MTEMCNTRLPAGTFEEAKKHSATDDEFKKWGIEFTTKMCQRLIEAGCSGLHFYTLNLEFVTVSVLKKLGLITEQQASICVQENAADAKSMVSAQGITTDNTNR